MSELIAIGYADKESAEHAEELVEQLHDREAIKLNGIAVIYVDEHGHSHIDSPRTISGITIPAGAIWGAVIGFLVFAPIGAAIGGALGAGAGGVWGNMRQHGIDDEFRRALDQKLTPGGAALVVMASSVEEDAFAKALGPHGGELIRTSLPADAEHRLAVALTGTE